MQQEIQKIIAITLTTSAERIPERPGKHENPVFFGVQWESDSSNNFFVNAAKLLFVSIGVIFRRKYK
jgi:hypothetical protein